MDFVKLPRGNCAVCGKDIPIQSVRDKGPHFCSRVHSSMARFSTRYRGTGSGPADRPDFKDKMTKL